MFAVKVCVGRCRRSGAADVWSSRRCSQPPKLLGVVGGLIGLVGGTVALIGSAVAVALVGSPIALVGDPVAHVRGLLAGVGDMVAVISGPVTFVRGALACGEDILGPVQGRLASGQPGLGHLQRLLGLPGPRLSRPHPGVIQGLGRQPCALDVLDNLLGDISQLARGRPRPPRSWWNAWSRVTPWVAASMPLACSIHTRPVSACRS
jgi:hypothetical protein